jgi:hypothetical protein
LTETQRESGRVVQQRLQATKSDNDSKLCTAEHPSPRQTHHKTVGLALMGNGLYYFYGIFISINYNYRSLNS